MEFLDTTIGRQFHKVKSEKGDEKSLFYKRQGLSWKEIDDMAMKMAADMLSLGIKQGSRIAIWCQNSPLYITAFFAIMKVGGVAVLVNPSYKTFEMNQMVDYADLRGIFCDENCVKKLQKTSKMEFINYIGMDAWNRIREMDEPSEKMKKEIAKREESIDPHDFACMLFTSGTTGGPKGVEVTHYQLLNVALRAVDAMRWNDKDKVCVSLPLYHTFGLSTGLLASLFHKGAVCLKSSYKSSSVMECVEKHKCTVLNGVPTMFLSILYNPERKNRDLSSLDSGIIAGSGVYEKDFLTIAKELQMPHLMQSFGQTEASPSITFSPYEDPIEKKARSTGKAMDGVEIRVIDTTTDEVLPPNQKGEVEIRGFNTMKGYFNLNAESEKILRKDGWMRTGDMGYLDEEGYLYICGRKKEMIIRGGENISPQEIEEVLLNLDGVTQVKVFGVKEEVIQENIAACIVQTKENTKEEVQNFVRKYLADYKVPKYVFFFEQFPENSSGKIDVKKLKDMASELRRE